MADVIPLPHALPAAPFPAGSMRRPGVRMRSRLLDAAVALFKDKGLAKVSVAEIARAGDAYPSQITYYFRTKEALFVEAACREVLYVAARVEAAGAQATTPTAWSRALVETALGSAGLRLFVEAMALTRHRPDLTPLIERTIERLHAEGRRAQADICARRGWHDDPLAARRFWTLALGMTLREGATGAGIERTIEDMLVLLTP